MPLYKEFYTLNLIGEMSMFNEKYISIDAIKGLKRQPNFENIVKVLKKQVPDRHTIFELFLNVQLYERLADQSALESTDELRSQRITISAFKNAGYDYATMAASNFRFVKGDVHSDKTKSLNEGSLIYDLESFEKYTWVEPENFECFYPKIENELPDGMKFITIGPCGVLENVIAITGYDNLCYMLADDVDLVKEIFDHVGSRLLKYYTLAMQYDCVGAAFVNDDWGFNTQTMLSPSDMRKFVVPWHRKIVRVIHDAGKLSVMHSCGKLNEVMDDIIDDIGIDGKHSYEDKIEPVEDAYERLHTRLAIMGGIDMDFVCRSTPEAIYARSLAMLERAATRGGYALGSGNSIPYYVPDENYFAMIAAALFN